MCIVICFAKLLVTRHSVLKRAISLQEKKAFLKVRQDVDAECSKCPVRVQQSLRDSQHSKREQKASSLFCTSTLVHTLQEKHGVLKHFCVNQNMR